MTIEAAPSAIAFGAQLRAARTQAGLTQRELADAIGASPNIWPSMVMPPMPLTTADMASQEDRARWWIVSTMPSPISIN